MKHLLYIFCLISVSVFGQNARLFKDINPTGSSSPNQLTVAGDKMFFSASDGVHGREVWVTDGTVEGTKMVKDISATTMQPNNITAHEDKVIFTQNDGNGIKLWITDGTEQNTFRISPESVTSIGLFLQPSYAGLIFFTATLGIARLYTSDGTVDGHNLVDWTDLQGGNGAIVIQNLTPCNENLYFSGGPSQPEPYVYNHDADSLQLLEDINPGFAGSFPSNFICTPNGLFFHANNPTTGRQLYFSPNDQYEVNLVKVIGPVGQNAFGTASPSKPFGYLENGDLLFFANDGEHGMELWRSDGTEQGTYLVKDINPGAAGSFDYGNPNPEVFPIFHKVGDGTKMLFVADDGTHGYEWFITDGTEEGTNLVLDFTEGSLGSQFLSPTSLNGKVYFAANKTLGRELWVTDGTDEGTAQLTNFSISGSTVNYITGFGNNIYFSANEAELGTELWIYEPDAVNINKVESTIQMQVYPNPGRDLITLQSSEVLQNAIVSIFDLSGKNIYQTTFSGNQHQIALQGQHQGMYLLKVISQDKVFVQKVLLN